MRLIVAGTTWTLVTESEQEEALLRQLDFRVGPFLLPVCGSKRPDGSLQVSLAQTPTVIQQPMTPLYKDDA